MKCRSTRNDLSRCSPRPQICRWRSSMLDLQTVEIVSYISCSRRISSPLLYNFVVLFAACSQYTHLPSRQVKSSVILCTSRLSSRPCSYPMHCYACLLVPITAISVLRWTGWWRWWTTRIGWSRSQQSLPRITTTASRRWLSILVLWWWLVVETWSDSAC